VNRLAADQPVHMLDERGADLIREKRRRGPSSFILFCF